VTPSLNPSGLRPLLIDSASALVTVEEPLQRLTLSRLQLQARLKLAKLLLAIVLAGRPAVWLSVEGMTTLLTPARGRRLHKAWSVAKAQRAGRILHHSNQSLTMRIISTASAVATNAATPDGRARRFLRLDPARA